MLPRSPDQTNRRVFVLYFDSDHLAAGLARLKQAAMAFVSAQFTPEDLGGVFTNGSLWHGHLTTDRQELLDGIRAVDAGVRNHGHAAGAAHSLPAHRERARRRAHRGRRQPALDSVADLNCVNERDNCALEGGREYVVVKLQRKAQIYVI